ncbi:putative GATA transcription factor 22 [Salvia splendens]|uniref:putative GATA transcription factor 22 n=1 Tax=Salvia splendens TaxID=180675 RepID=UPI001C2543E4|nr:putative GATA transcription factor 22 [Salvia splendens]
MNLYPSPSQFSMHQITCHGNDHEQQFFPNRSSSVSCHFFFDPTHDHTRFYNHHQLYQSTHHLTNYGSAYEAKGAVESGLKLTLWKEENGELQISSNSCSNPMRWMSSKMRVMQKKMKKTNCDRASDKTTARSNGFSYNNSPIRVCSDCNTTKTPLWRSGPKGPKSLCNACGIRQRKARRAMAAAAPVTYKGNNGHTASQLKKRCKTATTAGGNGQKRISFEDFLINLSQNLTLNRVLPDDEKDAAILLMALSSGLVN